MTHFVRLILACSAVVAPLPAQFHLPGLSGGGSSAPKAKPDATQPDATGPNATGPNATGPKPPSEAPPAGFDSFALTLAWPGGKPLVAGLAPRRHTGPNPESCGAPKPPSKGAVSIVAGLMANPEAARKEWALHGSCTGYTAAEYFNAMRYMRSLVQIPVQLISPDEDQPALTAKVVESWFVSANPGYPAGAFRASAASLDVCFSSALKPISCVTEPK